jgi:hypothetical protein
MSFNANSSFRKIVDVSRRKDSCCSLHSHFKHGARGIVSRLDWWAHKDPTGERFVFEKQMNTAASAAVFKDGKREVGLSWATMKRVMAELRELHIVSDRLVRIRNHTAHWGYIVAEHDHVCGNDGKTCTFVGPPMCCDDIDPKLIQLIAGKCQWVGRYRNSEKFMQVVKNTPPSEYWAIDDGEAVEYDNPDNPFWVPKGWTEPR